MTNNNYTIQFKSLREGTLYTVNIAGGSGNAIQLNGAAQPFTTDEDSGEDMFTPIRTQSGYIRIVDNGFGADGLTAFDWKDLLPSTDTDRPVVLTKRVNNAEIVVWQGFMQSQNFSGVLYGGIQEREFPVTCALSVLAGEDIDFNQGLRNFAFLLKDVCDTIDNDSANAVRITQLMIQGGEDARQWLQTKIDWQNFATEDSDGIQRAKYSLFSVLEDMCRFWGWTARTCGTTLYLTCADDAGEQNFLSLTRAQLETLAAATSDTTTGSIVAPPTVTLADTAAAPIFASIDNEEYKIQGPHRAVVKGECNKQDTVVKFAPKDIKDAMGDSYSWVQGDGDLVGYFTTSPLTAVNGVGNTTMKVWTPNNPSIPTGAIAKRQIYQSKESDNAVVGDMLMVYAGHVGRQENYPTIQLQTLRPMSFSGGSISLGGTAWMGTEQLQQSDNLYSLSMRLGIGMTRSTAKWWYMSREIYSFSPSVNIEHGWRLNQPTVFNVPLSGNTIKSTGVMLAFFESGLSMSIYPAIPVPADTYGYIFIDIMGAHDYTNGNEINAFEIANLEISYSRETIDIPTSTSVIRPRELVTERVTSKEYAAVNSNDSKDEWNANCIFASDNNMEYGYGLLLDGNGNIVQTVDYGSSAEHPEQHLADRVADYWATAKRKIDAELQSQMAQAVTPSGTVIIGEITPLHKVTLDAGTYTPVGISRVWRDDIVKLSLMQL